MSPDLRKRTREWRAANPHAKWIDTPSDLGMSETIGGEIAPWHVDPTTGVSWCNVHDLEWTTGIDVCAGCVAAPPRPSDVIAPDWWVRLDRSVLLASCGMQATLRCTDHDTYFDDATACGVCLQESA